MLRRFVNWFPLGMTYAFLYMARYNLNVTKNALGDLMTKEDFGIIFGIGTTVYGLSFLLNGPLVDKWGGKKGIIIASIGSCLANILMGAATFFFLKGKLAGHMVLVFSVLYSVNMYFQSFGGVSIIKVKAYWFHVRERGTFGAIFGTLISFGLYFAFDWCQAIADAAKLHSDKPLSSFQQFIHRVFAVDTGTTDATWLVFLIPAALLVVWIVLDLWLIKDTPGEANHDDFDTADASSGEMDRTFTSMELLRRVFTSKVMLTVAFIEFTTGIIRNGVLQWYFIFGKEVPQIGAEYFHQHWGLLLCLTGIIGGFASGFFSDKIFHSRRGPPAAILNATNFVLLTIMSIILMTSPIGVGLCAVFISLAVIGVHSIMSGTAAADFGGRKATATASGITDGFVYLGSGVQSVCLGYLTTKSWAFWPVFLLPFAVIGFFLALRIWNYLPSATLTYLKVIEKVNLSIGEVRSAVGTTGTLTRLVVDQEISVESSREFSAKTEPDASARSGRNKKAVH
ncbi:MAG: glycerol-3-phosphate transporter [Bacteriovoracaceae bacterium]|nr:glycerol-3-phosphate transporter [Bacteriovoracaceae bacterium]